MEDFYVTVIDYGIYINHFMYRFNPGKGPEPLKQFGTVLLFKVFRCGKFMPVYIEHLDHFNLLQEIGFQHHEFLTVFLVKHFVCVSTVDIFH